MALAEAGREAPCLPDAVTRALAATLASLAGGPATHERIEALCVADRQFLMRELQIHCGSGSFWLDATCRECGARFDFRVDLGAMPVQEAGAGFPFARLRWRGRDWVARLPTGADQAWLARADETDPDAGEALEHRLVRRLLREGDPCGAPVDATTDLAGVAGLVDDALDAVAPAVVACLAAACPECRAVNAVPVDSYGLLGRGADDLLDEVHAVATRYHWSESDILRLPRARRRAYLDRIADDVGIAH